MIQGWWYHLWPGRRGILGPRPEAGAREAGKLWTIIILRTKVLFSLSTGYGYLCLSPCLCVCLSLCAWMLHPPLCVLFLCMWRCVNFFCLVKCMFHSCGVTCHHFALCLNGSGCMRLCPIMSCCLFARFTPPCVSLWPDACFFLSVVYISLCLHLWVSFLLLLHVFDTLCPILSVFLCISPCEPPRSISLYLCSGCLWVCVSEGMHLCFCIFPCMYLPFSLFLSVPVGIVCGSCLFAPIYAGITEWVSPCVHFSLYVSLLSMPVGQKADKRSSHETYPLSDPVCQWKDLKKLSSPLLPLDRATANIFYGGMLIFIFLAFSNTFCWHSSFTLRISIPWSKYL